MAEHIRHNLVEESGRRFQPYVPPVKPPEPIRYMPDITTSDYSRPSKPERDKYDSKIDFIFCEHALSHMDRVWEYTRGLEPDIVAIESPTRTAEQKVEEAAAINRIIATDAPAPIIADGFESLSFQGQQICQAFHGSKVRVQFIDVDKDSSDSQLYVEPALKKIRERPWENATTSNPEKEYDAFLEQFATSVIYREDVVIDQIKQIAHDNPGKRIAIVVGGSHIPLYARLASLIPTSKTFIPIPRETPWRGAEKYRYGPEHRDIFRRRYQIVARQALQELVE